MQTILAAEDDAAIRVVLTEALAELDNALVWVVADGFALLEILETVHPDLLILDVNMPGLTGPELFRLVRARDTGARIPVLFLSAQSRAALKGVDGAYRWLAKPFNIDDLLQLVGQTFECADAAVLTETDTRPLDQPGDAGRAWTYRVLHARLSTEAPMLAVEVRRTYLNSVALAQRTGQWASVSQSGPTTWQCITHSIDPSGQVQMRLLAAGPVEELVVLMATAANQDFVRLHEPL